MTPPINIESLRANIGDDPETERALLAVFIESSEESLALLCQQFPAAENAAYNKLWKTHMHQLKGSALTIGAADLIQSAARAQAAFEASAAEKLPLLDAVMKEFSIVKQFIEGR